MATIKTDGIVLRHADYKEKDRMLTLLTPEMGQISVSARGCRAQKSKLLIASEVFASGEYLLMQTGDRFNLTGFSHSESFYPIRKDYEKLAHGVYWLNLLEAVTQPGEEARRLFRMLILSLAVLAYGDLPNRPLTAVFLSQLAILSGFAPGLFCCTRCAKPISAPCLFSHEEGGVMCLACGQHQRRVLDASTLLWLQEAQKVGAFVLAGKRALPQPGNTDAAECAFALIREHVERRLERTIRSGGML